MRLHTLRRRPLPASGSRRGEPTGERVSLAQLCEIEERDEGSEIYREGTERYVPIKYSIRGRDLGGAVEEAMERVSRQVQLPRGYHINWEGEYESEKRAEARLLIIVPLTVFLIFMIIYSAFGSAKWACLNLVNVGVARVGGLMALYVTGTHFSVSSGVGFMAYLASQFRPLSSCWNTSVSCARGDCRSPKPQLRAQHVASGRS